MPSPLPSHLWCITFAYSASNIQLSIRPQRGVCKGVAHFAFHQAVGCANDLEALQDAISIEGGLCKALAHSVGMQPACTVEGGITLHKPIACPDPIACYML